MAEHGNGKGHGPGDRTTNDLSGQVDGPVFQGRDFGDINIGAQMPEEAVSYYRRMQERLDAEEREKVERREAEERNRRELAESKRRAHQEAWNRRWDALVAERARIRKRVGVGFSICGGGFSVSLVGGWVFPHSTFFAFVILLLLVASFVGFVVGAQGFLSLISNQRNINSHKSA
ncbi:hypothetical protein E0500_008625 [Streptomyces sp. KM273126]|uniref:hypothetical protein n=1 Tax=Streptomyces sp. KM273126 TaxID=2545247 RepID=UPI00103DD4B6|nr:hypothetical protein [Streptomyces sp. KM273126]MBA2807477.1 hypothetical protein [Streptomyces sp. KM273126]